MIPINKNIFLCTCVGVGVLIIQCSTVKYFNIVVQIIKKINSMFKIKTLGV